MAKDVVIVPANGSVSFSNNGTLEAIVYNNNGDLHLSPTAGNVVIGDGTPSNIEVGNSSTSVDFTFLGGGAITGGGNPIDMGTTGDTVNMNITGVTYNFPTNVITTSNYTASDVLTKIKTVDGAGSFLDADLLDGRDWTAPGTIGSSVANTGNFTTVSATYLSIDGIGIRDTGTATTTATTQIVLASASTTTFNSAEFVVQATQGGNIHVTKLLVVANSTVASATEYGTVYLSSSLFTAEVDINAGNLRLLITPATTSSTAFRTYYQLVAA